MRRKKQKANFVPVVIILILLVLIAVFLFKVLFVIRSVEITGTSSISAEEIARAAELNYGSSIFSMQEDKIRRGIDSLGVIESVSVKKQLPSTIVIEVRTRDQAAAVVHQNEVVVLDANGYVITTAPRIPAGCVYFSGMHIMNCRVGSQIVADEGQVELMSELTRAITNAGATRMVKEVNIEHRQDIRITCLNGTNVVVGDAANIENKIAWMSAAVSDLNQRGQKGGTLDVSSGTKADYNGPIVSEEN